MPRPPSVPLKLLDGTMSIVRSYGLTSSISMKLACAAVAAPSRAAVPMILQRTLLLMAYLGFSRVDGPNSSNELHGPCQTNFRDEHQRFARSHLICRRFSGNAVDRFRKD